LHDLKQLTFEKINIDRYHISTKFADVFYVKIDVGTFLNCKC